MNTNEILLQRTGRLGHIVLNRPKAINALNDSMITSITAALREWAEDDAVETVLISGAGERGLCAGGDIVAIYRHMKDGGDQLFWEDEYRMNSLISRYPKPIVAFMDGVVLGGGVGVSAHASYRVVTERTKIGMPETRIGFVPDVGGCFLYSRAPGELGTHLALTAGTGTGADAIVMGLADYFVDSAELPALAAALAEAPAIEAMAAFPTRTSRRRTWIRNATGLTSATRTTTRSRSSPPCGTRRSPPRAPPPRRSPGNRPRP